MQVRNRDLKDWYTKVKSGKIKMRAVKLLTERHQLNHSSIYGETSKHN